MIDNTKEYLICAAIYVQNDKKYLHQPKNIEKGFVICGRRHHNCYLIMTLLREHFLKYPQIQGFLSNKDYFYDREEAYKIAKENGQFIFGKDNNQTLLSENLY